MSKVVAIHQPNYIPWMGYFSKISQSDVFIVLDNVQFEKGGYTNRCSINVNGSEAWLTQNIVKKGVLGGVIKDIRFADLKWKKNHVRTIRQNYSKCPYFSEILPVLDYLESKEAENLTEVNTDLIRILMKVLGLETLLVMASELINEDFESATARVVQLVKRAGGDIYLSGIGAKKYHNSEVFQKENLILKYSDFKPHPYAQKSDVFIPGLSILDAIANCGSHVVSEMIK